jgi:hemoglobin
MVQTAAAERHIRSIESEADVACMVDTFYERILADDLLAPVFIDVAGIDLEQHKHFICSYWEKLLFGKPGYQRHTMNIHRALAKKTRITPLHFQRWLGHFRQNLQDNFRGEKADLAQTIATNIAGNMQRDMVR